MQSGDLVLMNFPPGMLKISPFKQWNGQIGMIVEEVDARYNERFWFVICSGEIKMLAGAHLRKINEAG